MTIMIIFSLLPLVICFVSQLIVINCDKIGDGQLLASTVNLQKKFIMSPEGRKDMEEEGKARHFGSHGGTKTAIALQQKMLHDPVWAAKFVGKGREAFKNKFDNIEKLAMLQQKLEADPKKLEDMVSKGRTQFAKRMKKAKSEMGKEHMKRVKERSKIMKASQFGPDKDYWDKLLKQNLE